jgi:hypothetical protein
MTLILGMSKAEGIYMSADFRVTEYPSRRLIDDASVKMLDLRFPPLNRGSRALLAYTGLAILPGGLPVGMWLRETLRGESEYPDQAMAHLRSRLDRDITPLRAGLIVNVLIIEGEHGQRRLFGGFSNLVNRAGRVDTLDAFQYVMTELTGPFVFGNGSGSTHIVAAKHLDILRTQIRIRPRRAVDHLKLLATVNRRIAAADKTVSPACHAAFLPAEHPKPGQSDSRFELQSRTFAERGEARPAVMPILAAGIDLSILMGEHLEQMKAEDVGTTPPSVRPVDELNRLLRRRD